MKRSAGCLAPDAWLVSIRTNGSTCGDGTTPCSSPLPAFLLPSPHSGGKGWGWGLLCADARLLTAMSPILPPVVAVVARRAGTGTAMAVSVAVAGIAVRQREPGHCRASNAAAGK